MCGCCGEDEEHKDKTAFDESDGSSPLRRRGCTDVPVLIVFLAFLGGLIYISAYSIMHGNAYRLVFGYDSYGDTCGYKNPKMLPNISQNGKDLRGKNYVFYMNIPPSRSSLSICVRQCPNRYLGSLEDVKRFSEASNSSLCDYGIDVDSYPSQISSYRGPCPKLPVYESEPLLFRCIPSPVVVLKSNNVSRELWNEIISFINDSNTFQKVLSDLYNSWREMIGLCFVALGLGLLVSLLIRFVAGIIIWIVMISAAMFSLAATGVLWWVYVYYKNKLDHVERMRLLPLDVEVSNERAFLVFAIIATVLTSIMLLIMVVLRKRVTLAVALFNESGKCLAAIPCLFLLPVITFIFLVAYFIYWVIVLAFISTAGSPSQDPQSEFVSFEQLAPIQYMWWYHLVALIWIAEFILACEELVVAGAVAQWYFTRDKSSLSCTIGRSVCRLIIHHLGSVALGAFIITLVKLPRMLLLYLQKKLKGQQNSCSVCCLKCCTCCLWCLEKCMKYLNRNAYIVIAIQGHGFCASARKAFSTLVSNVLRVAAINSVGDFVLFLAKVTVMAGTALVGVLLLKSRSDLHYYAIPVLLCCIFSYFLASVFFSVYEMVIDAMLLCFCEDCRINDGTPGKEYYMSTSLMEFVKTSSRHLDTVTRRRRRDHIDGDVTESLRSEKTSV